VEHLQKFNKFFHLGENEYLLSRIVGGEYQLMRERAEKNACRETSSSDFVSGAIIGGGGFHRPRRRRRRRQKKEDFIAVALPREGG
jgi:hypothetical protein